MGSYSGAKQQKQEVLYAPSAHAARRYPALRLIAGINTALAYGVLLLGLSFACFVLIAPLLQQPQNSFLAAGCVVLGGFGFLYFLLVAESIAVVVDLEADARRIVHLLENPRD